MKRVLLAARGPVLGIVSPEFMIIIEEKINQAPGSLRILCVIDFLHVSRPHTHKPQISTTFPSSRTSKFE